MDEKNNVLTLSGNETEFFKQVAALISNARIHAKKQVDSVMIATYYEVGRMIVEREQQGKQRAQYGRKLLLELANYLVNNIDKRYSADNLKLMRRFYAVYSNAQIGESAIPQFTPNVSWTHYIQLMRIDNFDVRNFYEIETGSNGWTIRELQRQIGSSLYERLALSRDKDKIMQLANKGHIVENSRDIFKDPYILEFTGLNEATGYTESQLEQSIIDNLQKFLLELGKGFLFESRQKRFTFDEDHFFVDLVFYNRILQCYVIIDLKTSKLKHQDLGQMQMYVNYFDRYVKLPHEKPTIGILLCKEQNTSVVKLTLPEDTNIYSSEYSLCLPDKGLLQQKLAEWTQEFEEAQEALEAATTLGGDAE
jgi:predicted nuclease of restriction endonuclease-like (RecB) superfamily